ncbi:MAG: fused MFS/spermidine synthase [Myxococcota bacterium]
MNGRLRFGLVLACFALSGFAGLLYETVWTREFSFVFGTSGLAVSTVLAAYMGGLALGAAIAGRFVDRVSRPVLVYGLLELGIACSALAVPWAIEATRSLHIELLRGVTDPGSPLALGLYLATSFLILGVPTTFMGATLPLLARHAVQADTEVGSHIGALYSVNTLGAIFGTLTTAFFLMPAFGLRGTVYLGALLNAVVFLGAALLARVGDSAQLASKASGTSTSTPSPASSQGRAEVETLGAGPKRAIVAFAGFAGVASFTYEVLWVRLIEHVMGGSVYAFAAMLGSFLLGIALGGAIASRFATTLSRSLRGLTLSQLGVAFFSLLAYQGVGRFPAWIDAEVFLGGAGATLRLAGLATLVLLPSTVCIGAMFPFVVRALTEDVKSAAPSTARAYTANTLGAIVGSIAAGFWLLPALGFAGTLLFAIGLNLALAALAWWVNPARDRVLFVGFALVLVLGLLLPPQTPWLLLRSSPIPSVIAPRADDQDVLFHSVGRSASVIAIDTRQGIRIRTNGIPESIITKPGSRTGLAPAARWMGALPALSPAGNERMLMIGLGGGVALELVPSNVREIDVVELEPEVVAVNDYVAPLRQYDPNEDERITTRLGDARSILELEREPYDTIVSQPSHPWTAGSSHLYTADFFERVKSRLTPEGVFVQWLGLAYVDEELLRSFVATLCASYPNVRLYRPADSSVLFLASQGSLDFEGQVEALVAADPVQMNRIGIRSAAELRAALALDEESARAFSEGAELITDDRNIMATRAPQVFRSLTGHIDEVLAPYDPLVKARSDVAREALLLPLVRLSRFEQARRVAESLATPRERQIALSLIQMSVSPRRPALQRLLSVQPGEPAFALASWTATDALKGEIVSDSELGRKLAARYEGEAAVVIEGWRHAGAGRMAELAALDQALAKVSSSAPWFESAAELRVAWRVESGKVERAQEALVLLDANPRWTAPRVAVRAFAAALAGETEAAEASLWELVSLPESGRTDSVRGQALAALRKLPAGSISTQTRGALAEGLGASIARPGQKQRQGRAAAPAQ